MKIVKIIRYMGNGITNPHEVECDDGKKYVAKFPGNPEGPRALINEYIGAELAILFKLPIPKYRLVSVDNISNFISNLSGVDLINGTVFCSEEMGSVAPIPNYHALSLTTNSIDSLKTLLFDVIIGNNDRNSGNMLLNLKNKSFLIIDHSHIFLKGVLWDERSLKEAIGKEIIVNDLNQKTFNTLIGSNNTKDSKTEMKKYIEEIKRINLDEIDNILNGIPRDWQISEAEKKAIKMFLSDRIKRIEEISKLLNIGGD